MYPEDFLKTEFNQYTETLIKENSNKTTKGIFAPWAIYKEDITSIGMHDETFHSYHEDSDIFNRFILNGYELIQTWEAYVYHLTCRGGQFQDGVEQVTQDEEFHKMKHKAFQHYINKWGSWIKNDEYQHPVLFPVYKKKLIITNNNPEIENGLKFWFNDGDDIIVEVDGNTFTQQDFNYVTQLNEIIKDNGEIGQFNLGNLKITINSLQEHQDNLIKI